MANPTCTTASLNIACFRGQQLNTSQKRAFLIWYLAKELAAIGGTDYTGMLTKPATTGGVSLLNDAVQQFDKWDMDAMFSAILAIAYNNAVAAGASVSSAPNTTITSVRRTMEVDEITQVKMLAKLLCLLGRHKSYPQ